MTLEERMAAKMAARKKENAVEEKKVEVNIIEKMNIKELAYFDEITDNPEISNLLKEGSLQILNINAKSSLQLGKIFKDIESKLANKGNGIYIKFLKFNGYNRMSALRHRHRYELYIETKNENSKKLIASLPFSLIEKLYLNKNEVKEFLEAGVTREELESILENKKEIINREEPILIDSFDLGILKVKMNNIFDKLNKISLDNIDTKKQAEINKILDRLEILFK